MAAVKRDLEGWTTAVSFMRETRHARLANHINDHQAQVLANYLNDAFGVDAKLPKSPADMPKYKATVRPVSDDALKIVFTEYDMPGPNRMPFSAAPDKDGNLWIPDMGSANHIGRLDPRPVKFRNSLRPIHFPRAFIPRFPRRMGPCGLPSRPRTKWAAGIRIPSSSRNIRTPMQKDWKVSRTVAPKHTVRVDSSGRVWGTSVHAELTVYDPRQRVLAFCGYLLALRRGMDKAGNPWFAEFDEKGKIGMVDAKTGKVTKWAPPTKDGWPRAH